MTKQHHILLNSQFAVILNGIIFFIVRFCDSSLLGLKFFFRFFLSQARRYKGFPVTGNVNVKAKKKNTLVSRNGCDEKNLHPGGRKFIFLIKLIELFN